MKSFKKVAFVFCFLIINFINYSFSFAALSNGQNASDLLGQYDQTNFTDPVPEYTKSSANDTPNALGFSSLSAMGGTFDNIHHRFFLADTGNNRVLVFNLNTDNTFPDRIPDNVLGQANFYTNTAAVTQSGMGTPLGVVYDPLNNRLFVSCGVSQNRILVYDVATIANGENAVNVLGQTDFVTGAAGSGQTGLSTPRGLALDTANNRLFVADTLHSRVMIFDVATITNGENAVNVLGQANFLAGVVLTNQATTPQPYDVAYDAISSRLFVSSPSVNRVSIFDVATIVDGENAVNVLGQTLFTTGVSATTQAGMNSPQGLVYDSASDRLFVAQNSISRITTYNVATSTIANGQNAVNVLGQPDFVTGTSFVTQTGLVNPGGISYDTLNNKLLVSQAIDRVQFFDVATSTIANNEAAVDLLGQYDEVTLSNPLPNYTKSGTTNLSGFNAPMGIAIDTVHHRLFVSENGNRRVKVYNLNSSNLLIDHNPDFVLGQSDFVASGNSIAQNHFGAPRQIAYDPTSDRLFVADLTGNRVMIFDTATIVNGENAVNVLGQTLFTTSAVGNTQGGMNAPIGVAVDSVRQLLFVSQQTSNRVTVYNIATSTIANGQNAVNVLGQTLFTTTALANTQTGLNAPQGITYDSTTQKLYVAQQSSNRVTVYDLATITNGEAAVAVLGQSLYTTATSATTQGGMSSVRGVAIDTTTQRLFVSQATNRITVYDVNTITNGENAINVIGQPDFTSSTLANTQAGLSTPQQIVYDSTNDKLYVVGQNNNRVTVYNVAVTDPGFTISQTSSSTVATENGTGDSFTVVLNKAPTTNVVLNISSSLPVSSANYSPTTLTFTNTNWNVPQTVNLIAPEEFNSVSETGNTTVSVNTGSSAAEYASVSSQSFVTNIVDNDTAGFVVSLIDDLTNESGDTGSFTVVLTSQPTADVTIPIISNNTAEGTVSPNLLTFTSVNWNVPQTVTVTGVDDILTDGPINFTIVTSDPSSTDNQYNAIVDSDITDIPMTNQDNDNPSFNIIISNSSTTEIGATTTIRFQLSGQPAGGADVTIPLSILDNTEGSFAGGLSTTTITILNANWNTPSANEIVIYGVDDSIFDGNISYILQTGDPTSADLVWDNLVATDIADPTFINIDNETPAPAAVAPVTTVTNTVGSIVQTFQNLLMPIFPPTQNIQQIFQQQIENKPDLIGGGEPNVPAEFSDYVCVRYLRDYILQGKDNKVSEVKKLQEFLNENENDKGTLTQPRKLIVDGVYKKEDVEAVKRFQTKYIKDILAPWGFSNPTGEVFRTTAAKINIMMCAKNTSCPYFSKYLKKGDTGLDVVKLQDFLNIIFAPTSGYPTNGVQLSKNFDQTTFNAVKNYQQVYKETVLKPWDLQAATGWFYQSTSFASNRLMNCPIVPVKLDNGKVLQ